RSSAATSLRFWPSGAARSSVLPARACRSPPTFRRTPSVLERSADCPPGRHAPGGLDRERSTMSGSANEPGALPTAEPFDIAGVKERLAAGMGGYEIVHGSPGLEIGVYVLVAPEPTASHHTTTTRSTSSSKAEA